MIGNACSSTQKCNQVVDLPKINTNTREYIRSPLSGGEVLQILMVNRINELLENQKQEIEIEDDDNEPLKLRKYKCNNYIAGYCQRLMKITAYPSVAQLTVLCHQIKLSDGSGGHFHLEIDEIKSKVLQWFRKRREYLSTKVYNVCDEHMEQVWIRTCLHFQSTKDLDSDFDDEKKKKDQTQHNITYDMVIEEIVKNDFLMQQVLNEAKLPIKNVDNAMSFVRRKVKDYFTKLCTKT